MNNVVWLPEPLSYRSHVAWKAVDSCLCHVDIQASLRRVGLKSVQPTPDPMELHLVR